MSLALKNKLQIIKSFSTKDSAKVQKGKSAKGVKMLKLNYKNLEIWKLSKNICLFIYKITKDYPKEELYCLISQIRRCAISIPSNIAEGYAKSSVKEQLKFIEIAYGSYYELNTQIEISYDLKYINEDKYNSICKDLELLGKMLYGYKLSLQKKLKGEND